MTNNKLNKLKEKLYNTDIYREFVDEMNDMISDLTSGEIETCMVDISFDEENK